MDTRIAVVGESLVDIVADGEAHVGGSPLNVAVGLARLGIDTSLHTRVGADRYGDLITERLVGEKVGMPEGTVDDGRTSTATVTLDGNGVATYEFDLVWDLPEPDLTGISVVHTGSIGAVLEPGGTVARHTVSTADAGVLRSYDPNIRPDIMGDAATARRVVRDLAASCHVVKFSDEDATWIGADTGATAEDVLASIASSGPGITVMTRGEHGCTAVVDGTVLERRGHPVDVADTIGAGDAFTSGLLFALVRDGCDRLLVDGEPLPREQVDRVLETALASAAVAVSRAGAQPPTPAELDLG